MSHNILELAKRVARAQKTGCFTQTLQEKSMDEFKRESDARKALMRLNIDDSVIDKIKEAPAYLRRRILLALR
jgi:hypothetical protein